MSFQNKPDYLIFAQEGKSGEVLAFFDIKRGWGLTTEQTKGKPPLEWMNGAFQRVDRNINYLIEQGIAE
ncbi:hypothetical protein RHO15_08900 [Utexia brackfieldae]|uniref:hypothetical protein n=1 Tax=Utexia brackfieldae TaxID=3074108 RepID=UPI00370D542C